MDIEAKARPRFRSSVEAIVDSDDGLFLLSEDQHAWMRDGIFSAIAPMLNGAHAVESIFESLADAYHGRDILNALDTLQERGYLADDTTPLDRAARAFWEQAGVTPSVAKLRLDNTTVSIHAIGNADRLIDTSSIAELLRLQGINVLPSGDLSIVITDNYLHPDLAAWNEQALLSGQSWLLVKPLGLQTWLGPTFNPNQSACWECLAQRLRWHCRLEQYLGRKYVDDAPPCAPSAGLPGSSLTVLSEAAMEVARWIGTGHSILTNRVVTTDLLTLERRHHTLIHRPQCPACGSATSASGEKAKSLSLQSRPKARTEDSGGHRAYSPEDVNARLQRHLSPITGIVGALSPGERSGPENINGRWMTPNYAADHNFGDMHDERFILREGLRRRSGGKGKSRAQARASALGESLERYSGVFDGTEPLTRATYVDLGESAIHPNSCMGYSNRQYEHRDLHNQKEHKAHWVPEPFEHETCIDWTPLWSLSAARTCFLPTSYCYFGYQSSDTLFARADSNGCAAGAVLEEAILQGTLELIERDAVALWWYNRLKRPALFLEDSDDDYIIQLQHHYRERHRDLWVLDITSDFGIPCFAAISKRTDKAEEDIIYGFGCHLDPAVALVRAVTELNQSLEAVPMAGGDDKTCTYRGGEDALTWWRTVKTSDNAYLNPDHTAGSRNVMAIETLASNDLCTDIQTCVELVKQRGIEILVLDQTRPDVEFPVVRVVAPGLRHFWARFGPGRLYDVPVQQGWLQEAVSEEKQNPFVIQF